jgi:hypothetical protein
MSHLLAALIGAYVVGCYYAMSGLLLSAFGRDNDSSMGYKAYALLMFLFAPVTGPLLLLLAFLL